MKTLKSTILVLCIFVPVSGVFAAKKAISKQSSTHFQKKRSNSPQSSLVKFTTNFYDVPGVPSSLGDGNVVVFDASYSDNVDGDDATKLTNPGENFGLQRDGIALAIEARQPVTNVDTIYYDMWHMRQQSYQMEFIPENMDNANLSAFLIDNYSITSTQLSLSSTSDVTFAVNSDPASYAANRFEVVFINSFSPLPVTFTSISAILQSAAGVQINWKVAAETNVIQYNVEHSIDGVNFNQTAITPAKSNNGQAVTYSWMDTNPASGTNYYRIKSISKAGVVTYSGVVKEVIESSKAAISVYPNPVASGQINLVFQNQPSGLYKIRLLNMSGQEVYTTSLNHAAGAESEKLNIQGALSMGAYKLEAIAPNQARYITEIFIK